MAKKCDSCGDELVPDEKGRRRGMVLTDRTGGKTVTWRFCDEVCFDQWLNSPARREIWPSM